MLRKNQFYLIFILLLLFSGCRQNKQSLKQAQKISKDNLEFTQIKTDSVFNSNQVIGLLSLPKNALNSFNIEFGYNNREYKTTSSFAENRNALAAINGSFFDMKSGGSVTYMEINDSVISNTLSPELKNETFDSIINGAIVLTKDYALVIEHAKSDEFYELSKQESAVLVSGPVLLLNSEPTKLADIKFVNNRHPRTCMCLKKDSVVFVTIDGRQESAEGMSLPEVQEFLLNMGCIEAINLDGGGSTTMWVQDRGVVNFPSDNSGERAVSNAILITDKK